MLENTSNTTVALSATSSPLKHLRDGDSIISLGSPLPYLITLSVKNVLSTKSLLISAELLIFRCVPFKSLKLGCESIL